jgi:retinol dehydrogenase-12
VTGGYTGIGLALVKILYQKNATIYVAGRDEDKHDKAMADLKKAIPSSKGNIEFLKLDLADQSTIKASADMFLKKESRLDVLVNNAGIVRNIKAKIVCCICLLPFTVRSLLMNNDLPLRVVH